MKGWYDDISTPYACARQRCISDPSHIPVAPLNTYTFLKVSVVLSVTVPPSTSNRACNRTVFGGVQSAGDQSTAEYCADMAGSRRGSPSRRQQLQLGEAGGAIAQRPIAKGGNHFKPPARSTTWSYLFPPGVRAPLPRIPGSREPQKCTAQTSCSSLTLPPRAHASVFAVRAEALDLPSRRAFSARKFQEAAAAVHVRPHDSTAK